MAGARKVVRTAEVAFTVTDGSRQIMVNHFICPTCKHEWWSARHDGAPAYVTETCPMCKRESVMLDAVQCGLITWHFPV